MTIWWRNCSDFESRTQSSSNNNKKQNTKIMNERFMATRYKHLCTEAIYLHNCQMINKARALVFFMCISLKWIQGNDKPLKPYNWWCSFFHRSYKYKIKYRKCSFFTCLNFWNFNSATIFVFHKYYSYVFKQITEPNYTSLSRDVISKMCKASITR